MLRVVEVSSPFEVPASFLCSGRVGKLRLPSYALQLHASRMYFEYGVRLAPPGTPVVSDFWLSEAMQRGSIRDREHLYVALKECYFAGNWLWMELSVSLQMESQPNEIFRGLSAALAVLEANRGCRARLERLICRLAEAGVHLLVEALQLHPSPAVGDLAYKLVEGFLQE